MDGNKIVERIRKIRALAERAGTEEEAANAAARVAELCRKHNLEIGSIKLAEEETCAAEGTHLENGVFQLHYAYLADACKRLFDVDYYKGTAYEPVKRDGVVVDSKRRSKLVFYGLKANVQSALMTYQLPTRQRGSDARRLGSRAWVW